MMGPCTGAKMLVPPNRRSTENEHLGPPTKVIATNARRRDFGELTRGHEDKVIASISAQPGTMHGGDEKKKETMGLDLKMLG